MVYRKRKWFIEKENGLLKKKNGLLKKRFIEKKIWFMVKNMVY